MHDTLLADPKLHLSYEDDGFRRIKRLVVLLVKPSKYDERGYLLRFLRGVLPSNSSATMYALTKDAFQTGKLADLSCEVRVFDEVAWSNRVDPPRLVAKYLDGETKVVVGLVAVQTNQFPRACDLAYAFKEAGATVVMGGFHVSGSISTMLDGISANDPKRPDVPCPKIMPPEVAQLMENGIIVVHGESEKIWHQVLVDIVEGKPEMLYRGGMPDLKTAPLPEYPPGYFESFSDHIHTLDTSRGCPLVCEFCAIIQVQGRVPRGRDPQRVVAKVKALCKEKGCITFFFSDDNFSRSHYWKEILEGLIELRRQGYRFKFIVQIDLASYKIPNFVPMLGEAGCIQTFIGMESVDQETLIKAGKPQNRVGTYRQFFDMLHEQGIIVHAGYIIGFPDDTPQSIIQAVQTIKELGVDQVSIFILTPLPGSQDHICMYTDGVLMDSDFNGYDTFQAVTDHPNMSREELHAAYQQCWKEFYRAAHMIDALRRCPQKSYWWLFKTLFWYRNSALGEKIHPMTCGFGRIRSRVLDRRPGYPIDSVPVHWGKELLRHFGYLGHLFRELYVFQHVYFQSQLKPDLAEKLSGNLHGVRDWLSRTFGMLATRTWLNAFWIRYAQQKWKLFWRWDWHVRMVPYAITEITFTVRFFWTLARNVRVPTQG